MTLSEVIARMLGNEKRIKALELEISGRTPRMVGGGGGGSGGGDDIVTADTKANLPASTAPKIGYTTGAAKRYYVRHGTAWDSMDFLE